MRIQSHGDTRSDQPCTVPGTVVHLPLPPSLPSGDLGHIQQNSPVCWACTAWEVGAKFQAWAALGVAWSCVGRCSLSPGAEGLPVPTCLPHTEETSLSSQYLPCSSLEPECLPSPLPSSCLSPPHHDNCTSKNKNLAFERI